MISKNKIKYIHSLEQKKGRKAEQAFVAEGPKIVGELLNVCSPKLIIATRSWLEVHPLAHSSVEIIEVDEEELRKVSFLLHPQEVLAVFPLLSGSKPSPDTQKLMLALDGIQDPGNLGTIIRIADWFGIEQMICSTDTADVYNPKVVQATMGSIARVNITYTDLCPFIDALPTDYPVYGTLLDGGNIYQQALTPYGLLVMGNEGNGISPEIRAKVNHRLLIPNYPSGRATVESLNVAIATAIACAEFRRRVI
jgi:TrmH family RNA methyltransferase